MFYGIHLGKNSSEEKINIKDTQNFLQQSSYSIKSLSSWILLSGQQTNIQVLFKSMTTIKIGPYSISKSCRLKLDCCGLESDSIFNNLMMSSKFLSGASF